MQEDYILRPNHMPPDFINDKGLQYAPMNSWKMASLMCKWN